MAERSKDEDITVEQAAMSIIALAAGGSWPLATASNFRVASRASAISFHWAPSCARKSSPGNCGKTAAPEMVFIKLSGDSALPDIVLMLRNVSGAALVAPLPQRVRSQLDVSDTNSSTQKPIPNTVLITPLQVHVTVNGACAGMRYSGML